MWSQLREQVADHFRECSTVAGCLQTRAKPLTLVRPTHHRGIAVLVEVGTSVRRIVRFPVEPRRSGKGAA